MSQKSQHVVARVICIVLAFLAIASCFLLFTPLSNTTDYSHPKSVSFSKDSEGKTTATADFQQNRAKALDWVEKKIQSPIKLTEARLLIFSIFFFFLHLVIAKKHLDLGDGDSGSGKIILTFVAFFVIMIVANFFNAYISNDVLIKVFKQSYAKDEEVRALLYLYNNNVYYFNAIVWPVIGVILFAACTWFYWTIGQFFGAIYDDVEDAIKKRLFNLIIRINGDAVLTNFIRENAVTDDVLKNAVASANENLNAGVDMIQVAANGNVELVRYNCSVTWRPWPVLAIAKEVTATISLDNFYRLLSAGVKDEAFRELREKLMIACDKRLGADVANSAINAFLNQLKKGLKAEVKSLIASEREQRLRITTKTATKILQRNSTLSLRKFREQLTQLSCDKLREAIAPVQDELKNRLTKYLNELENRTKSVADMSSDLMPQNVRFHFRRGSNQIFVIEEKPQRRSLCSRTNRSFGREGKLYSVMLPYVVFVIVMVNNELRSELVYYRNEPLRSLDDDLFHTNLPNVNGDCQVCTNFPGHRAKEVSGRVEEVIGHFWQSTFNNDLTTFHERYGDEDNRLRNFSSWEDASEEDPLFFQSISLIPATSLRNAINYQYRNFYSEPMMIDQVCSEVDTCFFEQDDFAERLKELLASVKIGYEHFPLTTQVIDEYLQDVTKAVFDIGHEAVASLVNDDESAIELKNQILIATSKTLEEDFASLAGEVLLRRRSNMAEIIDQIKHQ